MLFLLVFKISTSFFQNPEISVVTKAETVSDYLHLQAVLITDFFNSFLTQSQKMYIQCSV